MASTAPADISCIFVQVVMATGQDTMRAALPMWAGLKILKPNPPMDCLATTMARMEPMATM